MEPSVSAIMCEDIREESSGKLIALGIFNFGFATMEFPVREQLCTLLTFTNLEMGEHTLSLQVVTHSTNKTIEGNIVKHTIEGDEHGFSTSKYLRGVPLEIDEVGYFELRASIGDGDMKVITRLPCIQAT